MVCGLKSAKGQALIELAIFGSFLIFLLGALINYGLNFDFRQQTMMESFRTALALTSERVDPNDPTSHRGTATVVLVKDRHIPNPSNPFAIGFVAPIVASETVTRTTRADFTPDYPKTEELPRAFITVDGQAVDCPSVGPGCTTAGFRLENNVPSGSLDRYNEVYGSVQDLGTGACLRQGPTNPSGGSTCAEFAKKVAVVDACEGEIISFEGCLQQSKMITDDGFCQARCERGRSQTGSAPNAPSCDAICHEPINFPWYAQRGQDGRFAFERLFTGIRQMGLQPGVTNTSQTHTVLTKQETGSAIRTTNQVNWHETVTRPFVYRLMVPPGTIVRDIGSGNGVARRAIERVAKDEHTLATQTTAW